MHQVLVGLPAATLRPTIGHQEIDLVGIDPVVVHQEVQVDLLADVVQTPVLAVDVEHCLAVALVVQPCLGHQAGHQEVPEVGLEGILPGLPEHDPMHIGQALVGKERIANPARAVDLSGDELEGLLGQAPAVSAEDLEPYGHVQPECTAGLI